MNVYTALFIIAENRRHPEVLQLYIHTLENYSETKMNKLLITQNNVDKPQMHSK